MSKRVEDLSMMELCQVVQDRNTRIFGERPQPRELQPSFNERGAASFEKSEFSRQIATNSLHLPSIDERRSRQPPSKWEAALEAIKRAERQEKARERQLVQMTYEQTLAKESACAEGRNARGNRFLTREAIDQGQQRAPQGARRTSNVHRMVAEQRRAGGTRYSTAQPQTSAALWVTNRGQESETPGASGLPKPSLEELDTAEVITGYRGSQLQNFHDNQQMQMDTQQAGMMMPKPPLAPQSDQGKAVNPIHRRIRRYRREGIVTPQRVRAGPGACDGREAVVVVAETVASMEGAGVQYRDSQAMAPRHEQGHQAAITHQNLWRDELMTMPPRSNRIVIVNGNQGRPARRVGIQHESNEREYSCRRQGLCSHTDAIQRELTFIRVLRKRF